MTPLTPTEIEELRIAIARECGWTFNTQPYGDPYWAHPEINRVFDVVPPYTTSIDAIQAACLERFKDGIEAYEFSSSLSELGWEPKRRYAWQLTALDWCIAFARTSKIWRYKV